MKANQDLNTLQSQNCMYLMKKIRFKKKFLPLRLRSLQLPHQEQGHKTLLFTFKMWQDMMQCVKRTQLMEQDLRYVLRGFI